MVDRLLVEDAVHEGIQACDTDQLLRNGDYQYILLTIADKVVRVMEEDQRPMLDNDDRAFISRRASKMVREFLDDYEAERSVSRRFQKFERVVCNVGRERRWAAGTIQAINEQDPADPTGQAVLPYVVKIDPPNARLISVPKDNNDVVRAELCFGQRAGALWFTLFCIPARPTAKRRFDVGERVVCAVEDDADDYSVWRAGTVLNVDYSLHEDEDAKELLADSDWKGSACCVPYRVQLDSGCKVFVHRDEHWLIRDKTLQAEGPRQAADGVRCLKRLEKRKREDVWEAIDHATRQVRSCDAPDSDDND